MNKETIEKLYQERERLLNYKKLKEEQLERLELEKPEDYLELSKYISREFRKAKSELEGFDRALRIVLAN